MRRILGLVLLLLASSMASSAGAEDPTPAARWAAAERQAVSRLERLGVLAQRERLFARRDAIYEEILLLDADHAKARRTLHYRRTKDGDWVRDRSRSSKDRGKEAARRRLEAALLAHEAWWRGRVLEIVPLAREAHDLATVRGILAVAIATWPDDPGIRGLAGQVRTGHGETACWVQQETATALANRARYLEGARAAARGVEAASPGQVASIDRPGKFEWPHVLQGKTVRVLGTVGLEELQRHAEIAEAASAVFDVVFGVRGRLPNVRTSYGRGFPIYVASSLAEGNTFLAAEPGVTERDLAFAGPLVGMPLTKRPGALVKSDERATREEATSTLVNGYFRAQTLRQNDRKPGAWASEGVSLYLRWLQVRTRTIGLAVDEESRYGNARPDVPTWTSRLADPTSDWHGLAAGALREMEPGDIHLMVGKNANKLTTVDMLVGYGICVYVMEAHPDMATAFFVDVASQERVDIDEIFRKHFDVDFETFRPRLLRWLDEMAKVAPPPGPVR